MKADENAAPVPDHDNNAQIPDDGSSEEVPAAGFRRRSENRRRSALLRAARLLPLATVAVWIVTIFVPVLDSGNSEGPRITITSLGDAPFGTGELNPGFIAIWILIVVFALLPWLFGHSQWWSATAILIGVVILLGLVAAVIEPPFLMWDGQTDDGMPTRGMEVARPDSGFVLGVIGGQALMTAALCGWIGGQRLKNRASAP